MLTGWRVAVAVIGTVGVGVNSNNVSVIVGDGMTEVGVSVGEANTGASDSVGVGDGLISRVGVALDKASVGGMSGVLDDAGKFSKGVVGVSSPCGVRRDEEDSIGALVRFELEMPRYGSHPLEFAIGISEAALATLPNCLLINQRIGKINETNISRHAINFQSVIFGNLGRLLV